MTESGVHVAQAKPVVSDEWRGALSLPIDDSHVITVALPLVMVLMIFMVALVSSAMAIGQENHHREVVEDYLAAQLTSLSSSHPPCGPSMQASTSNLPLGVNAERMASQLGSAVAFPQVVRMVEQSSAALVSRHAVVTSEPMQAEAGPPEHVGFARRHATAARAILGLSAMASASQRSTRHSPASAPASAKEPHAGTSPLSSPQGSVLASAPSPPASVMAAASPLLGGAPWRPPTGGAPPCPDEGAGFSFEQAQTQTRARNRSRRREEFIPLECSRIVVAMPQAVESANRPCLERVEWSLADTRETSDRQPSASLQHPRPSMS